MASSYPMVRMHREATPGKRIPGRKPFFPAKLPYERQIQRLERRIVELTSSLGSLQQGIDVSADPRAVVPERALVLELAAPLKDFEVAAQALGFEWLTSLAPPAAEIVDDEEEQDEESESAGDVTDKPAVLYVTMPTLDGLGRLLASWRRFKARQAPVEAEKALFKLFDYLLDLRTWSAKDRIDPGIARYVTKLLAQDPNRPILLEVDLWYRNVRERRDEALETLRALVAQERGTFLDFVDIEQIRYQGALVELPASVAAKLAQGVGELPSLDEIMTIRPQAAFEANLVEAEEEPAAMARETATLRPSLVAILDGYPVEQHEALKDRIVVREVDVKSADVPPPQRFHGTAMASLVVHGDLAVTQPSIGRRVVVVPILGLHPSGKESTPAHTLPIGVIHRALLRLLSARTSDPELRDIVVVNHSLCDTHAPFAGRPSPWAALLDYYSHEHRLLFVVSAGNIFESFPSEDFENIAALREADPLERQAKILVAFERALGTRGILSPAESVNALTVGAVHLDSTSAANPDIDPFPDFAMTNLASAVGPGVNRSIKPDLVAEGGRFAVGHADISGGGVNLHPRASAHMGQLVASPSATGDLHRRRRAAGTSNAAALVTRGCIFLGDALDEAFADEGSWLTRPTRAVILKALAAHGCSWGKAGAVLDGSFGPEDPRKYAARRRKVTGVLGYGNTDLTRVVTGADNRVTLLGDGMIRSNELHEFRIPVPASLLNTKDIRRIVVTVAWTTPIVTTTVDYRAVALQLVNAAGKPDFWEGVTRKGQLQPAVTHMHRGTLIHVVLEGKKRVAEVSDDKGMFFGVQALARHPSQAQAEIPYALAVTIEMAESQRSMLHQQMRNAIRARAAARVRVTGRT